MSISDLQALGAFVPVKPIKRTVECDKPTLVPEDQWADPESPEFTGETERVSIDVYLKRLSSADEIAIAQALPEDRPFVMVFRVVRNADGSPLFESPEQAASMASWVLLPIVQEIEKVAGTPSKNHSPPKTRSGSKSLSPSGGEARKSGKK